jgi:hypothetical protein
MIEEITIDSWEALNSALFADTENKRTHRFRSNFAYRGVSNKDYALKPGIARLVPPYPGMEDNLLKQFKKYAARDVVERDTDWHWLTVAQHHGLPTRLLDWSYSPLIATHFATANLVSRTTPDAAIWKVNFAQVHELLQAKETKVLKEFGSKIFSIDALCVGIPSIDALNGHSSSSNEVAVFFEPPSIDDRVINQFAYFSAISNPFLAFDDWLRHPTVSAKVDAKKIIIPSALKWEFRDKLDQCNINERVLMPGLDGLCAWLRRHYTPLPKP